MRQWSLSVPRAERLPSHYKHAVWWGKKLPRDVAQEVLLGHRRLYAVKRRELCTGRAVVGVESEVWRRIQPGPLDNRLKDINWLSLFGRLPVREVMHRHGLSRLAVCVRPSCGGVESIRHVYWECGFARRVWARLGPLLRRIEDNCAVTFNRVLKGWPAGGVSGRVTFLRLFLVSLGKCGLWEARVQLLRSGVDLGVEGVVRRILWDLKGRMKRDVARHGYHAARERWKGLFLL